MDPVTSRVGCAFSATLSLLSPVWRLLVDFISCVYHGLVSLRPSSFLNTGSAGVETVCVVRWDATCANRFLCALPIRAMFPTRAWLPLRVLHCLPDCPPGLRSPMSMPWSASLCLR